MISLMSCFITGKYGISAPWYFPLLPSYWAERYGYIPEWSEKIKVYLFTNFFIRKQPTFPEKMYVQSALPFNFEPEPTNLKAGVSLRGITKIYESKAVVRNLNLNFYEGNITALLGHNGAGKTTTISILTGLFPASSGTIFVYGKDIRMDQDTIRKNMGICMQHNVLFSYLTTKEHLFLYGYIKVPHWSRQELREEVQRTLKQTGLYNHRHKLAGSLSGGMKRKLSISIALLGGSKVVILDEPTTGVDPCSRRSIWEIISKNKKGRTIILSTHHLDEAEVLSDRVAFLESGGLQCCGSPFFLKETFGSGYHLTLTKKKSSIFNEAEDCDTSAVTAMIQSHLPDACLKEDIGGELVYMLPPFNSKVSSAYQSLLRGLDNGLSNLHIGCYGISDSTMEEVFLNLTKGMDRDGQPEAALSQEAPSCTLENDDLSVSSVKFTERDDQALVKPQKPRGCSSLLRKATALFLKRFHHTRRNVKGFIAQVVLPVLFVTAAMGLDTLRTKVAEYPALHLSPSLYGSSGQLCPKINLSPPHKKTFSSRTIYNLTEHDVETYLLATAKDFVQKRLSSLLDIIVCMCILIGYSITMASFVLYVVKEHQTKAKQLQHISGIGVRSYWVTNFIYDLVYFLVPVTLYATFSWMYLLAGMFTETGMAFIVYVSINLFFGINTIMSHSVLLLLSQERPTEVALHELAETLKHVFLLFPQFCFGYGLLELSQHQALMGFLEAYGVVYPDKTFDLDRIGSKLIAMLIQGTVFFSVRLLVDDRTFQKVWSHILECLFNKVHGKPPLDLDGSEEEEDKDVQAEGERVTLGLADYDMLQLQNLTRIYHLPHRQIMAQGSSLNDVDDAHWSLFGYCPQEDALDDLLTVEEHMWYFNFFIDLI
ncbi:ATP-binding cassette sub-family A member 12 [Varanus komodoensis]|nr:ATP-binding cassette sub-family A member 12 [Varanus komodoensis]